jgi:hypothetical protein
MPSPWHKTRENTTQPCRRDCPERAWDCKLTCPKWAAYEAYKQDLYAKRLEVSQSYDYTSHMARQISKRRVIDYKQGRNYR